jgi:hypothetical protein
VQFVHSLIHGRTLAGAWLAAEDDSHRLARWFRICEKIGLYPSLEDGLMFRVAESVSVGVRRHVLRRYSVTLGTPGTNSRPVFSPDASNLGVILEAQSISLAKKLRTLGIQVFQQLGIGMFLAGFLVDLASEDRV